MKPRTVVDSTRLSDQIPALIEELRSLIRARVGQPLDASTAERLEGIGAITSRWEEDCYYEEGADVARADRDWLIEAIGAHCPLDLVFGFLGGPSAAIGYQPNPVPLQYWDVTVEATYVATGTIRVLARSAEEAEEIAEQQWEAGVFTTTEESCTDLEFVAEAVTKEASP